MFSNQADFFNVGRQIQQHKWDEQWGFYTGDKERKKKKVVGEPVIIWKKEYETNKAEFLKLIQNISDYMLLNPSSLYDHGNPNHPGVIDAVKGKLNPDEYKAAERAYGESGIVNVRDNHFFDAAKNNLLSKIINQPFKFSVKNVSDSYTEEIVKKVSKSGAKMATNLLVEAFAQQGVDMSFAEEKDVDMSGTAEEIYKRLKPGEKLEYIIHKIIESVGYDVDYMDLAKDCFGDKFDINAEFAYIEVEGKRIRPRHLRPDQVRWISTKAIKNLEDPSVIAVSVVDYLSFTEILNKYRHRLNTGTGAKGILDAIKRLQSEEAFEYDPERCYFSEYMLSGGLTSDYQKEDMPGPNIIRVNYGNIYYPKIYNKNRALLATALEQRIFFKMFVPAKYAVEFNGKPATRFQWQRWLDGDDFNRELIPSFKEVDPDEKVPKGTFTVETSKLEQWEATRIGHGTLIDVGRYKYSSPDDSETGYVGWPVVAQISFEKSFGLLGYNLAIWSNILCNRIEEILSLSGLQNAILIAEESGIDPISFLYNAKKTGVATFNASRMNGSQNSPGAKLHLSSLNLGNQTAEISSMLQMVGTLKILYENMIGASPQAQGIAQPYSGYKETQMNIANQNTLQQTKFYEHNQFMNQVLQRIADIAKKLFAYDGATNILLPSGAVEFLQLTKELGWGDYNVHLESGFALAQKKATIDSAVSQVLASGGIDAIEDLISILLTDNPGEAMSIFRDNRDRMLRLQQQSQEQQAQAMQAQAQAEAQKNEIPVVVEQIRGENAARVQEIKNEGRSNDNDYRGNMEDIRESNDRERMILDSELQKERAENSASLQQINEELNATSA